MVFSNMFLMHGGDIILTFILTSYLEGECSLFESSVGAKKSIISKLQSKKCLVIES